MNLTPDTMCARDNAYEVTATRAARLDRTEAEAVGRDNKCATTSTEIGKFYHGYFGFTCLETQ